MPNINQTPIVLVNNAEFISVTIAQGANTSNELNCYGNSFLAMQLSVKAPSFSACDITFFVSLDNKTYYLLTDADGDIYKITQSKIETALTAASAAGLNGAQIPLDPAVFAGVQFIKINCSNVQTNAQTILFAAAPYLG